MEPRYLRQLAEIIDLGSLSLAAKSLNVTQPTLSRNIKSLEALVGAPVLQRGRYGVTPTGIGAALAREGRAIRDALRQADLNLTHWKSSLAGRLRIGVGTMLAHSIMPRFLAEERENHWRVALRIEVESPDRLIDRVRLRSLDAAIVQIDPYFPKEELANLTLFEDKRAYYAGVAHYLSRKVLVTKKEIARSQQVIVGAHTDRPQNSIRNSVSSPGAGPALEVSGDLSLALRLLATGEYIAALPEFVMKHVSNSREFVRLAYRGEMPTRMLSIWYRRDMAGHPLIKEFCQKFVRCVSELRGNVDSDTTALRPENRKKNNLKRYRRRT